MKYSNRNSDFPENVVKLRGTYSNETTSEMADPRCPHHDFLVQYNHWLQLQFLSSKVIHYSIIISGNENVEVYILLIS